jgi:[pyruvate, water dikinase]-phosphate phosphotransferase / [pyruvate, water dikinase] kinase
MAEQPPPIYVVSGGTGASGEQVVYTVLAQFPDSGVPVVTIARVHHRAQVEDAIAQAAASGGTIVHTMVDGPLRRLLIERAEGAGLVAIDLMGPLLERLSATLGESPLGNPGLYRRLNQAYFDRVSAIDYAMAHDDGQDPAGWAEAEIVLAGVSRVGKTPLSMYLAVLGWRTANVPLVPGIDPPAALFQLDPRRVIGLLMDPLQLVSHRRERRRRLGAPGLDAYADLGAVAEEMEAARRVFRRAGFTTFDVTDKPIEASAHDVMQLITRRFGE